MVHFDAPEAAGDAIRVREKAVVVHVLWGLLTVAFGAALVRGHFGAETSTGRLVGDLVLGALFVLASAGWIWFHRHPATLEISPTTIAHRHRGQTGSMWLVRGSGELYVYRSYATRGHVPYLKQTGSDDAIAIQTFDWEEVRRACLATGWRLVDGPS